jgi:hypothetical protein
MRHLTSLVYSLGQISLGLVAHPYQTMQSLTQDKIFVWMSLLPTGFLAIITVAWRWIIVPLVRSFFTCQAAPWPICGWLPFVSNWLTFFCVYWQILLLYLLFRFTWAFGHGDKER